MNKTLGFIGVVVLCVISGGILLYNKSDTKDISDIASGVASGVNDFVANASDVVTDDVDDNNERDSSHSSLFDLRNSSESDADRLSSGSNNENTYGTGPENYTSIHPNANIHETPRFNNIKIKTNKKVGGKRSKKTNKKVGGKRSKKNKKKREK